MASLMNDALVLRGTIRKMEEEVQKLASLDAGLPSEDSIMDNPDKHYPRLVLVQASLENILCALSAYHKTWR